MRRYLIFMMVALSMSLFLLHFVQARRGSENANEMSITQTGDVEADKDIEVRRKLEELLLPVGVRIGGSVFGTQSNVYNQLRIRWDAYVKAPEFIDPARDQYDRGSEFTVVGERKDVGSLPRLRAIELSSEQILMVGVNSQEELQAWSLIADPRVLRVEAPDSAGKLRGKVLHRSTPEFHVNVPVDLEITELRFYQPHWTGKAFTLELLGAVRF